MTHKFNVCREYVEKIFDYLLQDKTKEERRLILNGLRICLSGQSVGPPIWDLITCLWLLHDKQTIVERINRFCIK
jgi:hypothetical protein